MRIPSRPTLSLVAGAGLALAGLFALSHASPSGAQTGAAQCLDGAGTPIPNTLAIPASGSAQALITGTISTQSTAPADATSIQRVCFKYPDPKSAGLQYVSNLKVTRQLTAIESGGLDAGRFKVELVHVPTSVSTVVDTNATNMAMWDEQTNEHNIAIDRPAAGDALYDLKVTLTGAGPRGNVSYGVIPGGNTSGVKP